MLNDDCLSGLTWADLEQALGEIASPANKSLVGDFVTALWAESSDRKAVDRFLPESHTLVNVLRAATLLAGPECFPGSADGRASPS